MDDLLQNEWIQGPQANSSTPLMTPKLLSFRQPRVESGVKATMKAFHKAHREGFRLLEVSHAPLAKRRKLKKDSSTETRSSSGESIHSINSPGGMSSQGRVTPTQLQPFINPNARTESGGDNNNKVEVAGTNPLLMLGEKPHLPSTDSIGFSPVLHATGTGTPVTLPQPSSAAAKAAVAVNQTITVAAATTNNNNTVTLAKGVTTAPAAAGSVTQMLNPLQLIQLQLQQQQQQQPNLTAYAIPLNHPYTVPVHLTTPHQQPQQYTTHSLSTLPTIQETNTDTITVCPSTRINHQQ